MFQKSSNSNIIKIRPAGAELFHVDRQTDRQTDGYEKDNSRFSQFCKLAYNSPRRTYHDATSLWIFRRDILSVPLRWAVGSSKTLVNFYQATPYRISEDNILHRHYT